ncbi:hypothetical protein BHM03_00039756 [Ensete ventricosum]|uniref:UspA domain-containing protein n=1 Tax=Ensete ventricosum TaxID=4639 RepID=A0A445MK37_ENSVE|nr:hypothetical protein BHM03_00039756 [Ensete ventricosum]
MAAEAEDSAASVVGKSVMVVGIDDSEHSFYALQWTLLHFFSPAAGSSSPFKLVVVSAKPTPTSVIGLAGPGIGIFLPRLWVLPLSRNYLRFDYFWTFVLSTTGAADVLPFVESDLRKISLRVIEKAKEMCTSHSVTSRSSILR